MPSLDVAFTTLLAICVSGASGNRVGDVREIEKVFRSMPSFYEGWSDDYTCNFKELLRETEIIGISTALSLRARPVCWPAEDAPDEACCRADVILQRIRALIGPDREELFFSPILLTLTWRVVPRPERVIFEEEFMETEVLANVQIHQESSVKFTDEEKTNNLGTHVIACVRERLTHLFLVLGTNLAEK